MDRLRYFTAHISGFSDPNATARQQVYINALKTLPEVRVHYGNFFQKTVRRPLINLPVANQRIETEPPVTLPEGNHLVSEIPERVLPVRRPGKRRERNSVVVPNGVFAVYHTTEEKGSDVNLATHLLNDAWNDLFDLATVISTDTDLVTPIRMVKEERNKPVSIVCPRRKVRKELTNAASSTYHIFSEHLSSTVSRIPYGHDL